MKNKTFLWVAAALTLGFLFAACENPAKPTDPSGDAVADYLAQAAGGGSAADPVSLAVTLELTAAAWQGLLQTIADAGKFVALDISESTLERGGTEFDPPASTTGGWYVVSLVLPAAAESIKAPQYDGATFRDFTALKEVSGANIAAIGEFAFGNCRTLTSVSFPKVTSISQKAFESCRALTTASFPAVTSISQQAFSFCTSLTTASFPAVTSIDQWAFRECSALTTASFPKLTSIPTYAFGECSALTTASFPSVTSIGLTPFQNTGSAALTIELPKAAPSMPGSSTSSDDTYSKTVTIRTPPGRTGYNSSWQSDFKSKPFGNNVTVTLIFEEVD